MSSRVEDFLLNTPAAADVLDVSESKMAKDRLTGAGPPFVKIGRCVRYRVGDLREYVAKRVRRSTSEPATAE